MQLFSLTVFCSAFLLFAIQPMVAKLILPSFGGTAAVWSTCLVLFQMLLLGGYAYAHLIRTKLSPKKQRWIHLGLLACALTFLPPLPVVKATAAASATPVCELLRSLCTSIGFPFFVLSATAPLLMEWFRQANPSKSPDRLYALSNAGSLLALVSYPILIEPKLGVKMQANYWTAGMAAFVVICTLTAWRSLVDSKSKSSITPVSPYSEAEASGSQSPKRNPVWLWVALPACSSGLLMQFTRKRITSGMQLVLTNLHSKRWWN